MFILFYCTVFTPGHPLTPSLKLATRERSLPDDKQHADKNSTNDFSIAKTTVTSTASLSHCVTQSHAASEL